MNILHFVTVCWRFELFPVWAIMNFAAMSNTYKSFCGRVFSFLLGRFLGVELLGHMVSLCLTF